LTSIEEQAVFLGFTLMFLFSILPSLIISFVLGRLIKSKEKKFNWLKMILILVPANSVLFLLVLGATVISILLDVNQLICSVTAFLVYSAGFLGISYFAMILSLRVKS